MVTLNAGFLYTQKHMSDVYCMSSKPKGLLHKQFKGRQSQVEHSSYGLGAQSCCVIITSRQLLYICVKKTFQCQKPFYSTNNTEKVGNNDQASLLAKFIVITTLCSAPLWPSG